MTNKELLKIIAAERIKSKQANDSTKAKELESLWNELYDAKLQNPADIDTWVKSKGDKLAKFGLDANDDIDKILVKSDKEIYGKIPELQDKEYLDNLDKFSIAKLRSDARKNGFPSVQDYIQTAYKFKADREFMKSFEPDPKAGKIDKAREWIAKNFYPNVYEAIKNQPVYGTKSDNKIRNHLLSNTKYGALDTGSASDNKIAKSLIADQILNAASIGSAPFGGLLKQALFGGGIALASEGAGKYLSNKDIDPWQVGIGASLGAFGGRVAGKSSGDLIKSTAGRFGLKRSGGAVDKVIYGLGDVLENAGTNPKEEVAMARKASKKRLGPTQKERVDAVRNNPKLTPEQKREKLKNIYDDVTERNNRPGEYAQFLDRTLNENIAHIKNDPKLTAAQKAEELKKIEEVIKSVKERWQPEIGPNTTMLELKRGNIDSVRRLKEMLADPKKYRKELKESKDALIRSREDYWRQSLKNQLPTDENVKLHKDILKYSDPEFNAFKSSSPLYELDKPIIELEGKTGIPFRKAWAEPKFSSSLRTILQGGSQLGARKSRAMDDDDTESIYNAILANKPEDVEKYNSGLENNLTPYEKDIIQKFYIRK